MRNYRSNCLRELRFEVDAGTKNETDLERERQLWVAWEAFHNRAIDVAEYKRIHDDYYATSERGPPCPFRNLLCPNCPP